MQCIAHSKMVTVVQEECDAGKAPWPYVPLHWKDALEMTARCPLDSWLACEQQKCSIKVGLLLTDRCLCHAVTTACISSKEKCKPSSYFCTIVHMDIPYNPFRTPENWCSGRPLRCMPGSCCFLPVWLPAWGSTLHIRAVQPQIVPVLPHFALRPCLHSLCKCSSMYDAIKVKMTPTSDL